MSDDMSQLLMDTLTSHGHHITTALSDRRADMAVNHTEACQVSTEHTQSRTSVDNSTERHRV